MKKIFFIGIVVVVLIAALLFLRPKAEPADVTVESPKQDKKEILSPSAIDYTAETPKTVPIKQSDIVLTNDPYSEEDIFEEAILLKDFTIPEEEAIGHIHSMLFSLRGFNKRRLPDEVIDNVGVTNALLGLHKRKLAYLTQEHPRINENGELIDKYGSPYDFHFKSMEDIYVRSYGPDLEPFTDDDIVLNYAGDTDYEYFGDKENQWDVEPEGDASQTEKQ